MERDRRRSSSMSKFSSDSMKIEPLRVVRRRLRQHDANPALSQGELPSTVGRSNAPTPQDATPSSTPHSGSLWSLLPLSPPNSATQYQRERKLSPMRPRVDTSALLTCDVPRIRRRGGSTTVSSVCSEQLDDWASHRAFSVRLSQLSEWRWPASREDPTVSNQASSNRFSGFDFPWDRHPSPAVASSEAVGTLANPSRSTSPLAGFRNSRFARILAEEQPERIILPVRKEFWHSEVAEERTIETYMQWVYGNQQVNDSPAAKLISWRSFLSHKSDSNSLEPRRSSIRSTGAAIAEKLMTVKKQEVKVNARLTTPDPKRPFDGIKRTSHRRTNMTWFIGHRLDAWTWYTQGWKLRKRQMWIRKHRPTQQIQSPRASGPAPPDSFLDTEPGQYERSPNNRRFGYWVRQSRSLHPGTPRRGAVREKRFVPNPAPVRDKEGEQLTERQRERQQLKQILSRRPRISEQPNEALSSEKSCEGDNNESGSSDHLRRKTWSLHFSRSGETQYERRIRLGLLPGEDLSSPRPLWTPLHHHPHPLEPINELEEDVQSSISTATGMSISEQSTSSTSSLELVVEKYLVTKKRDTVIGPLPIDLSVEQTAAVPTYPNDDAAPPQTSPVASPRRSIGLSPISGPMPRRFVTTGIRARVERLQAAADLMHSLLATQNVIRKQVSSESTAASTLNTSAHESYECDRNGGVSSLNTNRSSLGEAQVETTLPDYEQGLQGMCADVKIQINRADAAPGDTSSVRNTVEAQTAVAEPRT